MSTLQAIIDAYLRAKGFTTYERNGVTYWGHPMLGQGRTFEGALGWAIGCEKAGRDLGAEAESYAASLKVSTS